MKPETPVRRPESAQGVVVLFVGPMFAGKTSALLGAIRDALAKNRRCQIFKHAIDSRYGAWLVTHDGDRIEGVEITSVANTADMRHLIDPRADFVAIDEVQFFDEALFSLVDELANKGVDVVASGLDLDSKGRVFETTARLVASANRVQKKTTTCAVCTGVAVYSKRIEEDVRRVVVGSSGYEPRCRRHF